jgi:pyruvate dehydrogenase E1 component alpha subunit
MTAASTTTSGEIDLYRTMARIRAFESQLAPMRESGLLRGTAHPCTGMEAVAAGVCAVVDRRDYVTSTHRGHGHAIAKGLDMKRMMAEIAGRVDGYCRGRGGSMHITSLADGMLGADGIVGGSLGLAVGAGYIVGALRGEQRVVVSFFGDGAINEGSFHEAMNLASVLSAPVVFVCENNQWAMSTRISDTTNVTQLSVRAEAYGVPGVTVDGNDVIAVRDAAQQAVTRARSGQGPALIEAVTYRIAGHSANAPTVYASDEEVAFWTQRDPLLRSRSRLVADDEASVAELDEIDRAARAEAEAAMEFAAQSPLPDPATVLDDVYAQFESGAQ